MSMLMPDCPTAVPTMLPHYEGGRGGLYEGLPPHPPRPPARLLFRVPRVVQDQKLKFETDELFKRLARDSEQVRYTGYRDRPAEERRQRFLTQCREGEAEIVFTNSGTNLHLTFTPAQAGFSSDVDFNKEPDKVYIKSHFIMNGVCVRWRGHLDLERLDGIGCLEFDEESARLEDAVRRDDEERFKTRMREYHDTKPRTFKLFPTTTTTSTK